MRRTGLLIAALGFGLYAQIAQADWAPAKRLTWNSGYSWEPAVAVDSSGRVHVVWHDDTPGNFEIYYKRSTDGGSTWTAPQRLSWNTVDSEFPDIAVDSSGHLHVVWHDFRSRRL